MAAAVNNAGGDCFAVDDTTRLLRFLILGSEGGTYYVTECKLTLENASAIHRLITEGNGKKVVSTLLDVSENGRAHRQSPTLFALAMVARFGNEEERHAAYDAIPRVCRTPTMLFEFVELRKAFGGKGWGKGMRRAMTQIYTRDPLTVAYACTKYPQRNGWKHRDALRLCHIKPPTKEHDDLFHWITTGLVRVPKADKDTLADKLCKYLTATETVRHDKWSVEKLVILIKKYGLVREHLPSTKLNSRAVWTALLDKMPLTAMIRNLGKMTSIGLFSSEEVTGLIEKKLSDPEALKHARVHPFGLLLAKVVYDSGHGDKGKLVWSVDRRVSSALDAAFYLSFRNVEPTGKRYVLGLDVSGSMASPLLNSPITARQAAAAMAMVTVRTEKCHIMGFSGTFVKVPITPEDNLTTVVSKMSKIPMGSTDCSLPMLWALENGVYADVFVVYTDNETWAGRVKPVEALRRYRSAMGIDAKLIVVGTTSTGFSIADPTDRGMLDVVGFDASAPQIMNEFVKGTI